MSLYYSFYHKHFQIGTGPTKCNSANDTQAKLYYYYAKKGTNYNRGEAFYSPFDEYFPTAINEHIRNSECLY